MRRLVILLIILFVASFYAVRFFQGLPLKTGPGKSELSKKIEKSRISIAYVLDDSRWTEFSLKPESKMARILSNAVLPADTKPPPEERLWYAFEYRILNTEKKEIVRRKYYHHTRLTLFYNEKTETEEPSAFFLDSETRPADLRSAVIKLDELGNPAFIRIRLFWKDPRLTDVLVRVYCEETVADRKIAYMWRRLSEEQKQLMAKGNVYPPDFLTESEKRNLLETIWRPMGPEGLENQDYRIRRLYVIREIEGERMGPSIFPQGLFISQFHHGMIPIPESGGKIRLEMTGLEKTKTPGGKITVRWYGLKAHERYSESISWAPEIIYEHHFNGGLLEISTGRDLVVRAYLGEGDERIEITPEPLYVKTYRISEGAAAVYAVNHIRSLPTPFRFDFRTFRLQSGPNRRLSAATVNYVLTGTEDRVLKTGAIRINPAVSLYDRFSGDLTGVMVSDPEQRFFHFPANVQKVRFTSKEPVLISGYNRPPDMLKKTRAPEDYYKYHLKDDTRQPTWFPLRPLDYYDLIPAGRVQSLIVQYKPPEDKPDYLAGRYAWESFIPDGDWRGRYLFVPLNPDQPAAEDRYNIIYSRVPANTGLNLRFRHSVKRMRSIRPSLFFEKRSAGHTPLKIIFNGRTILDTRISGRRGEIDLPPVSAGEHHIRIAGPDDGVLYLSNAGPGDHPVVKRLARKLDHSGLQFVYNKTSLGEEALMAHFFSPYEQTNQSVIDVRINSESGGSAIGPHIDHTLTNRKFFIKPDPVSPVPVLHTQTEYVDHGRAFYLPLGSDSPPGKYRIRFKLENKAKGYIIFSKITPGEFEKRQFYNESRMVSDETDH